MTTQTVENAAATASVDLDEHQVRFLLDAARIKWLGSMRPDALVGNEVIAKLESVQRELTMAG